MDYTFSPAGPGDAAEIFALYDSLRDFPGSLWDEEYPAMENVDSDIRSGSLYVLRDGAGRIAAAVSAGPVDELAHLPWPGRAPCELGRLSVRRDLQRQGLASLLLRRITPQVKRRGFDGMRLLVGVDNYPAIALYEKLGFTRLDRLTMFGAEFFCYQQIFGD